MESKLQNLVYKSSNGNDITDTIRVADYYGRLHKNIMKSVRRLIEQGNASEFHFVHPVGGKKHFLMTRKGFELVSKTLPHIEELKRAALNRFGMTLAEHIAKNPESSLAQAVARDKEPKPEPTPLSLTPATIENAIQVKNTDNGRMVNARQLHAFINGGATDFSTWLKRRVEQFGFVNGEDFTTYLDSTTNEDISRPGRKVIEYAFTIDAAKELCMVEGNDRGRAVRRYFIEVERKFREAHAPVPATPAIPQTFAQALRLAAEQAETIEAQQKQLAAQQPKVNFATALEIAGQSILVGQLAKLMRQNGVDTGEIRLYQWLRDNGFLHKTGTEYNNPTQRALEMGLFEIKTGVRYHPNTGEPIQTMTTLVTVKGQEYFINKFIYKQQNNP